MKQKHPMYVVEHYDRRRKEWIRAIVPAARSLAYDWFFFFVKAKPNRLWRVRGLGTPINKISHGFRAMLP